MAAAEKPKKSEDKDDKGEKKKGGKKPILLVAIGVVVLAAAGGGAWFFLGHKADDKGDKHAPKVAEVPKPAQYFPMDPAIVVNLADPGDGPQYLQVEVQLVTRDPEELKLITENAPAIRAHLLMLLSQTKATDVADLAGKQKLQKAALAETQKVMTSETGKKCVEELLFTSFVTQ
ncbi:flagellar basal body protein FliL [Xanthomonas oryzae pv. oryzae]|uniref:Flagellar protein FliL n=4 Tax=Xanthomonas oryzae TaxID=347 RepID=Q5GZL0_XANOR|nr:flagellar basal body-associated FliL family protein [Xanthomonas oryzae]AAW75861.1 flagellar protein [Xanthomonas oryzae pv. oryzae KACC 10331]ACD59187.1 flagellar basal body-associated protein FliL [Xanthomonas oryzae pv. oryzae PXO99A]ACD59379.1 flagellar basal body-associated protein FliL [Xanthomonas oryzae pv. oryzae PXO99A]AJQ83080.1 flagellar basal body protein FliL [Xanthomonas oryzae pv. oryzae PXO86]ALZ72067.1 flagellar basal body protein FliL [Xanthomonas oryzae pv. oryzae]